MSGVPPGSRITRDVLLHEVSRALREQLPDRAELLIRELERRLVREPPSESRGGSYSATIDAAGDPTRIADVVTALVDGVERRLPNGPRYRWGVRVTGHGGGSAYRIDVRATPAKRR